jgi:hypothetical protein
MVFLVGSSPRKLWSNRPSRRFARRANQRAPSLTLVHPSRKKYFAFRFGRNSNRAVAVLHSSRGAFRDRHGRWVRDAMDAVTSSDE